MKQRITVDQLKELTGAQQNRLREWYEPQDGDWFYRSTVNDTGIYGGSDDWESGDFALTKPEAIDLPLLSIGMMIELLADFTGQHDGDLNFIHDAIEVWTPNEMCDRLWEEVKIKLEGRHPRPHLTVLEDGQSRSTYLSGLIKNVKHRK